MDTLTPDETILGLLAARPAHGYHLLECFRDPAQLGQVWQLSTSQLYAVLKRLEKQGLIHGIALDSAAAPTRTEYQITPQGITLLQAWLNEPDPSPSIHRVRVVFLSRLYIARLLGLPTQALVKRQQDACRQRYRELQQQQAAAPFGVGYLTLDLVTAQMAAILAWIDRCELMPRQADDTEDERCPKP